MSLVGSLEDLGLGDILQIVHLSRKSGVLLLRGDAGEGQILFEQGLVRAATTRDAPQSLRELLAKEQALPADALAAASQEARRSGTPLAAVIAAQGLLAASALEELRARAIADAVTRMFRWQGGEFSFEVREGAANDDELAIVPGLNPQFLALEGTRRADEAQAEDTPDLAPMAPEAELSLSGADAKPPVAIEAPAEVRKPEPAAPEAEAPSAPRVSQPAPVVVIDPSLPVLEWMKAALAGHARVHTFQHTELGIQRIRQYLVRQELPVVILSAHTPPDPVSGARDAFEVGARLRRQAPRLPIVLLHSAGTEVPKKGARGGAPNAVAARPKDGALADAKRSAERMELAARLREVVEQVSPDVPEPARAARAALPPASDVELVAQVIGFAAQTFSRVALFAVRGDVCAGIAQSGLAKAGGPDDQGLRDVHVDSRDSAWFRAALDSRRPLRAAPSDEGDQRLAVLLGNEPPPEAWVAPLESAGRVVSILYADNLPSRRPLGETDALEQALRELGTLVG
jgi:hypothetical protein